MLFGTRMNQKQNQNFVDIIFSFLGNERPINRDDVVKTTLSCRVRRDARIGKIMIEESLNGKMHHRHGLQKVHWRMDIPYNHRVARRNLERVSKFLQKTGMIKTAKRAADTLKLLNDNLHLNANNFDTDRWWMRTIKQTKELVKISV